MVPPAAQGEFAPLFIGPLRVSPPVVLAPMAGVTNAPFRTLCRHFGAGLFVSEMIAARALVEGNPRTERLASFAAGESPRSLQLYATEPRSAGEAVARLVGEGRVDHIDLNFGCPVPKVTRRGGGAAIPLKPRLLQSIVRAAVSRAAATPVTMKFRTGIDENLQTFLDSGRIAQEEGCAAVALHARSAAQLYDGAANWSKIAALKDAVREIPVLGNGDIWEAQDALRMMRSTGCDGVVVGRGCLGRPWLFRDLADVFDGRAPQDPPRLGEIAALMLQLAQLLAGHFGEGPGLRAFRKHAAWFTKGFPGSAQLRARLVQVCSLDDLRAALTGLNPALPFPPQAMRVPRGKKSGRQRVALPPGYLRQLDSATPPPREAEAALSGG
ncbi:MAG: tRNA dihydrouridine synthase DusB [Deltaproteobacteria bacterium]|nr:tRNA dihydrouridine synthase DusB [Deltaproteobacteria bacterium]